MKTDELKKVASQVRRDIVRMVHGVASGHPGGSLGCTDLLVSLYFQTMELKTDGADSVVFDMSGTGEDMFFLSNGHISPVLYSVMARRGYFPVSELATFRKLDSRLQGHPATAEHLPGIRVTGTGTFGCGRRCLRQKNPERFASGVLPDGRWRTAGRSGMGSRGFCSPQETG
jgi:transketolase